MAFKDKFRDLYELIREHTILRAHNVKPNRPHDQLLLFAEGSVVLILLERFLRILPGVQATEDDTLHNLLEKAACKSRRVLEINPAHIEGIKKIRNTILHGNFEQAAKECGLKSSEEYFKNQYASEIEGIYKIVVGLFDQIDPETGDRRS